MCRSKFLQLQVRCVVVERAKLQMAGDFVQQNAAIMCAMGLVNNFSMPTTIYCRRSAEYMVPASAEN